MHDTRPFYLYMLNKTISFSFIFYIRYYFFTIYGEVIFAKKKKKLSLPKARKIMYQN